MLDLVPLAGVRQQMTHTHRQAHLIGEFPEFNLPQADTQAINFIVREVQHTVKSCDVPCGSTVLHRKIRCSVQQTLASRSLDRPRLLCQIPELPPPLVALAGLGGKPKWLVDLVDVVVHNIAGDVQTLGNL